MSTAKTKPVGRKAVKPMPAAETVSFLVLPQKATKQLGIKLRLGSARRDRVLSERLRAAFGEDSVTIVGIADARSKMPQMIRSSAKGHTYLIGNDRAADAPAAVLIGLEELDRMVAEPVAARTLGDVLATLPFSGMDLSPPEAGALPGTGLPTALIPT